jgi:hypothetical protein
MALYFCSCFQKELGATVSGTFRFSILTEEFLFSYLTGGDERFNDAPVPILDIVQAYPQIPAQAHRTPSCHRRMRGLKQQPKSQGL